MELGHEMLDLQTTSMKTYLLNCPINTHIDIGVPSETHVLKWIRAWFDCLKYEYHISTRKLIEDCFLHGKSHRQKIGKKVFFKEIQNAARIFRLKLDVREAESDRSVCHLSDNMKYSACSMSLYRDGTIPVNIEITLPDNHVLKTIDFSRHVLVNCHCKSSNQETYMMRMEEILQRKIKKQEKKMKRELKQKIKREARKDRVIEPISTKVNTVSEPISTKIVLDDTKRSEECFYFKRFLVGLNPERSGMIVYPDT